MQKVKVGCVFAAILAAWIGWSFGSSEVKRSQEPKGKHVAVSTIAAQARDVETLEGIMAAFYEVISGPPGQPRQWARDRTLYIPEVRFVATFMGNDGKPYQKVMSHQEFVDLATPAMLADGFYEREVHRVTRRFGAIAHIFSTYETRQAPNRPMSVRGVNSIQLFFDGKRWWIASVTWDEARQDNPIPKEFLP